MSVISAGTTLTTALVQTGDTNGNLVFKTGASGTTALTLGSDQSATFAGAISLGALTTSGNLTFTGTGNRITGDFSNGTVANRVAFQTSTSNTFTVVNYLPNGTAVSSAINLFNNSDPTNAGRMIVTVNAGDARLDSSITGTGTYLPLTMYTGGSEKLRIDTSGNVGIGTSSPSAKLHISGSGLQQLTIQSTTTNPVLFFATASGQHPYIQWQSTGGSAMKFYDATVGLDRLVIDSSGNVGIGTSSPTERLVIVNASSTAEMQLRGGTTAANYSQIGLYGGSTRNAEVSSNSAFLTLDHQNSGVINFRTGGSERMRITSTGAVVVNGTAPANTGKFSSYSDGLGVAATFWFQGTPGALSYNLLWFGSTGNGGAGALLANQNTVTLASVSDYRTKTNVEPLTNGISRVMQLAPKKFNWVGLEGEPKTEGFIAHEVQAVVPDAAFGEKDAVNEDGSIKKQMMDASKLIPLLTAAIQEQQAIITDQASTIAAFEARLTALENK